MMSDWIPPYALGVLILITGISGPAAGLFGIVLARSNRARVLWSAIIPTGALAALALSCLADANTDLPSFEAGVRNDHLLVPITHVHALTDEGRIVSLKRAAHPPEPATFARLQATLPERAGVLERVRLLTPTWQDCNCHGWVFTGGRYFIDSDDVPDILRDNGYYVVAHPRAGDLAVYRYADGRIAHTGIVYAAAHGRAEVQSKWGIMGGVYRHASHVHPYHACECVFQRTGRGVHVLRGLDAVDLDAAGILITRASACFSARGAGSTCCAAWTPSIWTPSIWTPSIWTPSIWTPPIWTPPIWMPPIWMPSIKTPTTRTTLTPTMSTGTSRTTRPPGSKPAEPPGGPPHELP